MLKTYFTKLRTTLLLALLSVVTVNAWGETKTISIGTNPTNTTSGSYLTTDQEFTIDGVTFVMCFYNGKSGQVRGNQSSADKNFYLYNKTAIPGTLKSISINDGNNITWTNVFINTGNSVITTHATTGSNPSSGIWNNLSGTYFSISFANKSTSGTATISGITITYESGSTPDDPSIAVADTTIAYDATSVSIPYTINNPASDYDLEITYEGDWLSDPVDGDETVSYTTETNPNVYPRTATVTLTYSYDKVAIEDPEGGEYDYEYAKQVTKTVTVTQEGNPTVPGSESHPFTVVQAIAAIDANGTLDGVYVAGIISQIDSYNSTYKSITYWISDDGTTTNQFEVYSGKGLEGADFSSDEDLLVGGEVVVYGTIKKFNTTYEFNNSSKIVSLKYSFPVLRAEDATIDYNATSGMIKYTLENPVEENYDFEAVPEADWLTFTEIGDDYISFTCDANVSTAARTSAVTLTYTYGNNQKTTATVTVTQLGAPVPEVAGTDIWVETNLTDLTEDDVFVIVGNNGQNYAMTNDNGTSNLPAAVEVTVQDCKITGNVAANIQWTISGNATDGYTFYPAGETETWLYCTATNKGVRVGTNDNKVFTVKSGYLYNTATERYLGVYNSQDWRCYESINDNIKDQTFKFYKKVVTYTRTVTAGNYGTICLPYATSETTGADFFTVSGKVMDGEELQSIVLEPVEGQLEAGVPYIFKATASELTATLTGAAVTAPVAGALVGTFVNTTAPMGSYVLSQNLLYVVDSNVTIAANRAYIDIEAIPAASGVKGVTLGVGNATGINQAPALGEGQAVIYDLQGRRVSNPTKGLYIVNGKKVLK